MEMVFGAVCGFVRSFAKVLQNTEWRIFSMYG